MALLYIAAGVNHFVNPKFYLKMMPPYLPFHNGLNITSGIFEIILGILLFIDSTRVIASWLIILLLIAVFPANIQMAINFWKKKKPYLWLTIVRLPLQFVLIWWAWLYSK